MRFSIEYKYLTKIQSNCIWLLNFDTYGLILVTSFCFISWRRKFMRKAGYLSGILMIAGMLWMVIPAANATAATALCAVPQDLATRCTRASATTLLMARCDPCALAAQCEKNAAQRLACCLGEDGCDVRSFGAAYAAGSNACLDLFKQQEQCCRPFLDACQNDQGQNNNQQ